MDTQVFVCVDDVNAATKTQMFAGSMKVCDRYELLPAMLSSMLPFSGFLTLGYLMMDVFSRSCWYAIVPGWCIFIRVVIWFWSWERLLQFGSPSLQDERNGRTGVLHLADYGSGCDDIGCGYRGAWWGCCSQLINWYLRCVWDTDRQ